MNRNKEDSFLRAMGYVCFVAGLASAYSVRMNMRAGGSGAVPAFVALGFVLVGMLCLEAVRK